MTKYLIVYLGGNPPSSPEEGQKHFAKYKEWLTALGEDVISPANPLKNTHVVSPNGDVTQQNPIGMSGYTIIQAASIEEALARAKSCPFLDVGGTLEVSELVDMTVTS